MTNAGTITATNGSGIRLLDGGSVDNAGTASLIYGYLFGVDASGPAATVTNAGTIESGPNLKGAGVELYDGGTVIDAGRIAGGGAAIRFGGVGAHRLVLYPGYALSGTVAGSGSGTNTIELASATSAGTVSAGLAGEFVSFGTLTVDAGAQWALSGSAATIPGISLLNGGCISSTVTLDAGSYLHNEAGGTIQGTGGGLYGTGGAVAVANAGTITAGSSVVNGIDLIAGGSVTNEAGGLIRGFHGVFVSGGAGTVANFGTIEAAGTSGNGIVLRQGGTVFEAGLIEGSSAIYIAGTGNLLALEHGYSLAGAALVNYTANTLELLGATGAVGVDFDKSGAGFTNFGTVEFGAAYGNAETLTISNTATLPGTVAGFTAHQDTIDLAGFAGGTIVGGTLTGGGQLLVANGGGTVTLQLDTGEDYTGVAWKTTSDLSGGTLLEVACFCRGTLLLTEEGEVAVEDLQIGDKVVTRSGAARSIKWIGRRSYDGRFIAGNKAVLPIVVAAGALADGIPRRDLWLSPGHALFLDGVLVKAEQLVNGMTVRQVNEVGEVEYFHIELETHDILVAEGAPAESYVDCDNRGLFHNAAEFVRLYPGDDRPHWAYSCPPIGEEELAALRERLLARVPACGWGFSSDPDLHLLVDGGRVHPDRIEGETYTFRLPGRPHRLRICSRCAAPYEVGINQDRRRLGAAVRRITLRSPGLRLEIGFDEPSLVKGFHDAENAHGHRWTDGEAVLPARFLDCFVDPFEIEIDAGRLRHYPVAAAAKPAVAGSA